MESRIKVLRDEEADAIGARAVYNAFEFGSGVLRSLHASRRGLHNMVLASIERLTEGLCFRRLSVLLTGLPSAGMTLFGSAHHEHHVSSSNAELSVGT